jgi:penicillin-binding protein 1C
LYSGNEFGEAARPAEAIGAPECDASIARPPMISAKRLASALRPLSSLSLLLALAVLASWATLALIPHRPLQEWAPQSTAVVDRNGQLLRLALARDERYRLWTPLAEQPPRLIEAVQLQEDQWFRWHPGFNPVSLLRGAWVSYVQGGSPQGGSTLSMQLARLLFRLETRDPLGKLVQIARALQLEAQYSKDEILEAYLNYAPFGGNIEGVGAASLIYFGKPPEHLSLAETLTLAVLPQDPSRRLRHDEHGAATPTPGLLAARERLYARWRQRHGSSAAEEAQLDAPLALRSTRALPFEAPHLVDQLLAGNAPVERVQSTLDLDLQRLLHKQVRRYLNRRSRHGLDNAVVMLVDTRDMGVRALIGSANWHDRKIAGQVNGALGRRSPGSTLKPFLYGLAIDQGVLHPASVLRDVPTNFGPFTPENFDGRFNGPLSATEALVRSRNIPAVAVAHKLGKPQSGTDAVPANLYRFLQQAGVRDLASEDHYGLALALGGGEVRMTELAQLYALLGNDGQLRPLRWRSDDAEVVGLPLLSAEAAFLVRDMLRQNPRPDLPAASRSAALPVAWKTGTSWGFRDAWTAGLVGPYALVVWIGHFDGRSNPALIGVEAAAPLYFEIIDALRASGVALDEPPRRWPLNLRQVELCLASGELPNADCPQRRHGWFIPGVSPITLSRIHRRIAIDRGSGLPLCSPAAADDPDVQHALFEFWPSELARVFAQAGIPRRKPPVNPACPQVSLAAAQPNSGQPPAIASPQLGLSYLLPDASAAGSEDSVAPGSEVLEIPLRAHADAAVRALYWFVDDAFIGQSQPSAASPWLPTRAGRYRLRVVDDLGRSAERTVTVATRG